MFGVSPVLLVEYVCLAALLNYSQYAVLNVGSFSLATVGSALIGAYVSGLLEVKGGIVEPVGAFFGVLAGVAVGLVVGRLVAALRGVYQAIATLAFVVVVQELAILWVPVTGGEDGLNGIPMWATLWPLVGIVCVVVAGAFIVGRSQLGDRIAAIRSDEVAAEACGINVARYRLLAMVVSGGLGALAGVAMAANEFSISPSSFGFTLVVVTLAGVVVGGYRHSLGPLLGAAVLTSLSLGLASFAGYDALLNGVLLLGFIVVAPDGVSGVMSLRRLRYRGAGLLTPARSHHAVRSSATVDSDDRPPAPVGIGGSDNASEALNIRSVSRAYGGVPALQDVSLSVARGEIVGLIGSNGAGKSTLVNLVTGVVRLDEGDILIGGTSTKRWHAHKIAGSGVARTFQVCRLFGELSVIENVLVSVGGGDHGSGGWWLGSFRAYNVAMRDEAERLLGLVGYIGDLNADATALPYVDQRRVEIARALALRPRFLLLDEPAAGMSDSEGKALARVVAGVAEFGVGVLVIEHNVQWLLSTAMRVVVLHLGSVIAQGVPADVLHDEVVARAYFGD